MPIQMLHYQGTKMAKSKKKSFNLLHVVLTSRIKGAGAQM
jgi:hypothetical protein